MSVVLVTDVRSSTSWMIPRTAAVGVATLSGDSRQFESGRSTRRRQVGGSRPESPFKNTGKAASAGTGYVPPPRGRVSPLWTGEKQKPIATPGEPAVPGARPIWACSSSGRATPRQGVGGRFESSQVHCVAHTPQMIGTSSGPSV